MRQSNRLHRRQMIPMKLIAILLGLLFCTVGFADYKLHFVGTHEELFKAIEDANKNSQIDHIINITGIIEINETDKRLIITTTKITFRWGHGLIFATWKSTGGGTAGNVTVFEGENASVAFFTNLFLGDKGESIDQATVDATHSAVIDQPTFVGFDTIIEANNSIVMINGVSASCDRCIQATDSRIIVANSDLNCGDSCIENFVLNETTADPVDFDALREGLMDSDLSAADLAALLRHVEQKEGLLDNYDVAVVDSSLIATRQPMNIGSNGGPDNRVLIDRSCLETIGTQTGVLTLKNPAAGSSVKDSIIFNSNEFTTLEKALRVESGELTVKNTIIQQAGQRAITLSDGSITFRNSTIAVKPDSPDAVCSFSTGNSGVPELIVSEGFNIVSDDSCNLHGPGDQQDTDPGIIFPTDGSHIPQFAAGSPAIDGGPAGILDGELPCSLTDFVGTARPQDGNGDGVFECDVGPLEAPGTGQVSAAHSATFFNVDRNGEGNFVEILNDSLAVVYTFTYRPDGSGPAWFVGVGDVNGNSIVIDDLLRPVGTSFGDDFDASEVDRTPIGGMSMVFPDCEAANPGGNVAYSGEVELGYEALISKATRLSHITGCGAQTPHPNAGLSGSYFDFIRDGEGIIVQWLDNGQVLAIFFTYDQNDNQFWVLGQAAADGKTVTMDALYPSTSTSWGSGFDADDITLSDWGTFTLTWTDCNTMTFEYSSPVEGFGSATRNYIRLSTLSDTACPEF